MDSQLNYALRHIFGTGGQCLSDEQAIQLIEICEKKLSRSKGHFYFCNPPQWGQRDPNSWHQLFAVPFNRISYPGYSNDATFRTLLIKRGYNTNGRYSRHCTLELSHVVEVDSERKLLVNLDWDMKIQPNKIHLQLPNELPISYSFVEPVLPIILECKNVITVTGVISRT